MDWIWIGFGFNISELNGYGLDLELELSPSGTSDCTCYPNSRPKYETNVLVLRKIHQSILCDRLATSIECIKQLN